MKKQRPQKFVTGTTINGRLVLIREDGSKAITSVIMMRKVAMAVNNDATCDLTFLT